MKIEVKTSMAFDPPLVVPPRAAIAAGPVLGPAPQGAPVKPRKPRRTR